MSANWSTITTGLVGIAGIAATYFGGRQQANVTLRIAREERLQRRLEGSYIALQRAIDRYAGWAASVVPIIAAIGQDEYPPPPTGDDIATASAMQAYWSPDVRAAVERWTAKRNELAQQVSIARVLDNERTPDWLNARNRAHSLKQELREAENDVLAQMTRDLHGEPGRKVAAPRGKKRVKKIRLRQE